MPTTSTGPGSLRDDSNEERARKCLYLAVVLTIGRTHVIRTMASNVLNPRAYKNSFVLDKS